MTTAMTFLMRFLNNKCVCLLLVLYAWFVLVWQQSDMLYAIQDFSPWMGTADYWWLHIGHPGGLREWIGDWLTQLFYYPWLGGTLMVLSWGVSACAQIRAYKLHGWWCLLTFIPMFCLLAAITEMGYWMFCLKAPSYWFGPTLGWLSVSLSLFGYSHCKETGRQAWLAGMILIGYPILGWYATLAVLTMVLMSECRVSWQMWFGRFAAIALPLVMVTVFYHHSSSVHWEEDALTYGFHHLINPEASSWVLELPFWIMASVVLLSPMLSKLQARKKTLAWFPIVLVAATLAGSNMLNYRSHNFHAELRMLRAMDEGRWDDMLRDMRESSAQKTPTRQMVIMKDVALAQKVRLGDEAFSYPIAGIRPAMNTDLPIHMAHSAAPLFYYWLGIPNFAFMWCMENNIEYGLSPFYLRMMYRCMMANGECEAAAKYKALLQTTLFHHDYEVSTKELADVRRFMTGQDELTNDRGYSEIYLLERLSQMQYDTPEAQQIAVHWSILARNQERFDKAMARYLELVHPEVSTDEQTTASASLPKFFNQQTFDWYYASKTGNKSY